MPSDYIPDSADNRYNWLGNLKKQVTDNSAALKLPADKVTAFGALLDPLIAIYKSLMDADAAQRKASGDAQSLFAGKAGELRAFINVVKANSAFTDGMGQAMQIFTNSGGPAPADIKPSLTVQTERGHVRIAGSKNYAETVNIYMRRKAGAWVMIAPKRKRFPFLDETPPLTAGQPEEREYMARGVIGDDEIGQDSDIVSAVFAG